MNFSYFLQNFDSVTGQRPQAITPQGIRPAGSPMGGPQQKALGLQQGKPAGQPTQMMSLVKTPQGMVLQAVNSYSYFLSFVLVKDK